LFALALPLAACGSAPDRRERAPAPAAANSDDPAVALAADPKALKDLRHRCHADREAVGDALCAAAARATRMRFMNEGATVYTPAAAAGAAGGPANAEGR